MARKTKEEAEATRESVLMAALDLFSERGYSHATFSDIARRIGMTRGAVYWHFDNKPALLAALIEYICERKQQLVGETIRNVHSVSDMRRVFVAHTRVVAEDAMTRKFEFFMQYQMEWSAELLTETHKKLTEIRESPLKDFKACFKLPEIAACLRSGINLDQLILTLMSFWLGLCKMYLGRCPRMDFDSRAENGFDLPGGVSLAQMAGGGFDLIMNTVLKKECGE
jgi:AcrR family transcriptional regulator